MKICWTNIEGLHLTKNGNFNKDNVSYIYHDSCSRCGDPFLSHNPVAKYCGYSCSSTGRKFTKETKRKMSRNNKGNKSSLFKHGMSNTKSYRCMMNNIRRINKKNNTSNLKENEKKKVILYYQVSEYLGKDWNVDHIQPISKGGSDHPDNLQILPNDLNFRKKNQYPLSLELERECEEKGFRI